VNDDKLTIAVDMLTTAYCKMSATIDLDHQQADAPCQDRMSDANHERLHSILRLISFSVQTLTGESILEQPRVKWYLYQTDKTGYMAEPEEAPPDAIA
jgi:hypothetical protein